MVSKLWLVAISFTAAQFVSAAPQQNTSAKNFVEESRTGQLSPVPEPAKPATIVTPEMRGDIFMARKMFREAIQAYEEGGKNSPVLLNKTGIAYHQMLELGTAEKYY